jgi:hypothetical protein
LNWIDSTARKEVLEADDRVKEALVAFDVALAYSSDPYDVLGSPAWKSRVPRILFAAFFIFNGTGRGAEAVALCRGSVRVFLWTKRV